MTSSSPLCGAVDHTPAVVRDELSRISSLLRSAKSGVSHYPPDLLSSDHQWLLAIGQSARHDSPELLYCLQELTVQHYLQSRSSLSISTMETAVEVATRLDDRHGLRRSLLLLGVTLFDSFDIGGAFRSLAAALPIAQELGDREGEASVWNNLGSIMSSRSMFSEASLYFARSAQLSDRLSPDSVFVQASINQALCSYLLRDYETSLAFTDQIPDLLAARHDPKAHYDLAVLMSARARALAMLGRQSEGLHCANQSLHFAQLSGVPRAHIQAELSLGVVKAMSGSPPDGLATVKQAVHRAKGQSFVELHDALTIAIGAAAHAGHPADALAYLKELFSRNRPHTLQCLLMHHNRHLALEDQPERVTPATTLVRDIRWLEQTAVVAELVEDPTGRHIYRVGALASHLAAAAGQDHESALAVGFAARLHDLGKFCVPGVILRNPWPLTPGEREIVEAHSSAGASVLAHTNLPHLQTARLVAMHHHERWDGTGYPGKLSREAIPEAARIVSIADVFDVLTHDRPYRARMSLDAAVDQILAGRGRQFDPRLADVFADMVRNLMAEHRHLDDYLSQDAQHSPFIQARDRVLAAL